jgi:hypothetical protein
MVNVTTENATAILSTLQRAVKAQVELHLALRDIESELGEDADGLDEYVTGLAFNCNTPHDALTRITTDDAEECIKHCFAGGKE